MRARTLVLLGAGGLLSACLVCLAGCGRVDSAPPPIILVSIDTLRADRLPAYGYDGVETPALDDLRRHSVLFDNAYTHMPLTLPAHASILTGLLPPQHGVRINMGYRFDAERSVPISTMLATAGYATAAAVSSYVLRAETGLASGFDLYEDGIDYKADVGVGGLQRSGTETLEAVLPWLRENAGEPFFLFLHIYEPHRPYSPPEPFASRYSDAYDGEVAASDAVVGRLVEELRRLGIYDQALILVTADHGEGLGDHGEDEHGVLLYQEAVRVPLLVKAPYSDQASTVAEPAQHVDLVPTMLEAAGLERPDSLPGSSLFDIAGREPRQIYLESYYPRLEFGWSELRGLVDDRYAFLQSPEPELYDLLEDPLQRSNLLPSQAGSARHYAQALRAIGADFEVPEAVDTTTRRQLEALGYVGGSRSGSRESRLAPQTQTHLLGLLKDALQAATGGRLTDAVELFDRILVENPDMVLAWEHRSRAHEALQNYDLALEDMLQAAARSVGSPHLYLAAGRLAGLAGRYADVEAIVAPAMEWDPERVLGWMVQAALGQRQPEQALDHARAAVEIAPTPANLVQLARVLVAVSRPQEALSSLQQAEAAGGSELVELLLVRAMALRRAGRSAEAIGALEEQRVRFPEDARADLRLARLLAASGEIAAAQGVLRELAARRKTPRTFSQVIRELRRLGDSRGAAELADEARELWPDPALLRTVLGPGR